MLYYVYITQNGEPKTGLSPDFQSLPAMKPQADKFTTKTSYQSPAGNQTWGNNVSDFIEVVNPNDRVARPQSNHTESKVDSVFRVVQGSNAPPIKQVQILRMTLLSQFFSQELIKSVIQKAEMVENGEKQRVG